MARRSKYTPEVVKDITDALKIGATRTDAALLGGISKDTFYEWMGTHPDFSDAIARAEAEAKEQRLKRIMAAGIRTIVDPNTGKLKDVKGDWKADAWVLERRFPADFGNKVVLEIKPEHADLLKKLGLAASDLWLQMMQELANANAS